MRRFFADTFMDEHFFFSGTTRARPLRRAQAVVVHEWERAVLFRLGALARVLEPGRHRVWTGGHEVHVVDTRPWVVSVPTQEVPTADGATVKVNVAGQARVVDAAAFVTAAQSPHEALYLAVQLAVRTVLGGMGLEDLVTGRQQVGPLLLAALADVSTLGIVVDGLEVKDLILPPDLKRAQAEVLVARAQGLAALERARGETAALRGLANAARLAADNPALLQLRLLQELGNTSGHTVVIGAASPLPIGPPAAGPGA